MTKRLRYTTDQVEMALRNTGGLRTLAAQQLGCVVTTVSNYVNRSKYLQRVEAEIIEQNLDFCEAQLIKNAKEGKEQSLFKYLDAKGRHRGYGIRVETTGLDGGPIRHAVAVARVNIDAMSDDEVDEYLASRRIAPAAG